MMHQLIVVGGGNVGDVEQRLGQAMELIEERIGKVVRRSAIYRSEAWGFSSDAKFTNMAFAIDTTLSAADALDALHRIEAELGRNRTEEYRTKALSGEKYAERTIDLDIALYDRERIVTPHLMIPHAALLHRDFFIEPICEVLECSRETLTKEVTAIIKGENDDE